MKILIVTDVRFWLRRLGSQQRVSALCDYLAASGHELRVLFFGQGIAGDQAAPVLSNLPYTVLTEPQHISPTIGSPNPAPRRIARTAKAWTRQALLEIRRRWKEHASFPRAKRSFRLQTLEPKLQDFVSAQRRSLFRAVCQDFQPDAVIVEYVRLAQLLAGAKQFLPAGCVTLIDTHDVQYERQSRFHERGEQHDIDITPLEEATGLSLADAIVAIQARDAALFRALMPNARVIVVGHPSPLVHHEAPAGPPVRIGFFGSDMAPNQEAAEILIRDVWPALHASHRGAVLLHIFGAVCKRFEKASLPDGVILEGFAPDLEAAYARLHIVVNPVQFGGGLKIKNVEALCHGKPLITTPVGAEGLEDGAGRAFVVATSTQGIVAALGELIVNNGGMRQLGDAAIDYAKNRFASATAFQQLDLVLGAK